MTVPPNLAAGQLRAYRLHDPAQQFVFPWVWTLAGAQWLNALVHRAPWDRCGIEQTYVPHLAVGAQANAGVPWLAGQTPEPWYQGYVSQVEGLCRPSGRQPRRLRARTARST